MADRRWDRRRVLRGLLLAGAGLAVPAACGVPTGGGPIVDGTGPASDPIGGPKGKPPEPDGVTSPTTLVQLFLSAVSGPLDTSDYLKDAEDRARRFLTPPAGRAWQPADQVTVVRVSNVSSAVSGPGVTAVRATLRPVGLLDGARGEVRPYTGNSSEVHTEFTVVTNANPSVQLLIDQLPGNLPSGLLLSTDALDGQYYYPQLVYFWDAGRRGLVPDLRYVPRTKLTDREQQAAVVNWLIAGPSDLMSSVATSILPTGTTLLGPAVVTDAQGALVVNFSGSFQGVDLNLVMAQLRWSLNPLWTKAVQLQIVSRPQQVDGASDRYLAANPADQSYRNPDAEPFCVVGGVVAGVDAPYPIPAVLAGSDHNRNVAMAALSRDKRLAALVTTDKRLWLGRLEGAGVSYAQANLTGPRWSRPAWLPNRSRALVAVDDTLYAVTPVGTSSVVQSDVAAFSVAPDGYRIALVTSAGVVVAALRDDGDRLSVGTPRALALDRQFSEVSGVAWTRLDRMVVAGRAADGWGLAEVSIDGAIIEPWTTPFNNPIVSVVAYPRLPSQPSGSGQVMVQTSNGLAFRAFQTSASSLAPREPSASPSGDGTGAGTNPTAPFYLD